MRFHSFSRALFCSFLFACALVSPSPGQQEPKKSPAKASPESEVPAQIELLETRVRFETNGDSRKEVHTLVHILNELGAQQFGRLNFDYNRAFQAVEIPQAHISHPEGGSSDILPSAVTDNPNPAVVSAPAYQDVRVKSVRILGLSPGDTLEYRVITTTSHHPLAPDFWLDHSFDRSGVVAHEIFVLDLPAFRKIQMKVPPNLPAPQKEELEAGESARVLYKWNLLSTNKPVDPDAERGEIHLSLTTYSSWQELAERMRAMLEPKENVVREFYPKATELIHSEKTADQWINSFYDFVSQKIRTVELPLGATGFRTRSPSDVITSGYATSEDKFVLFAAIGNNYCGPARAGLVISHSSNAENDLPLPSAFDHLLTMSGYPSINVWMDLNLEVAPYRMIPAQFREKRTLLVGPAVTDMWPRVIGELPFPTNQEVSVDASLGADGRLTGKVHYLLRGDNELLLRVAFHQTPKEKWKELAQLLSISDGFRGQVSSVNASDPTATHEPFSVDYEITEPKFLDWSKKPLRVPALLPQLGLPDPHGKAVAGAEPTPIDLGTPLEAEIRMTLHLPPGSTISAPTGTSVQRDYATFTSRYSAEGQTATALRHIRFIARQIPADRAFDLNAFLGAVQTDEGQTFILDRQSPATPGSSPKP